MHQGLHKLRVVFQRFQHLRTHRLIGERCWTSLALHLLQKIRQCVLDVPAQISLLDWRSAAKPVRRRASTKIEISWVSRLSTHARSTRPDRACSQSQH